MVKPKAVLEIERKIKGRTFLGFFHSLFYTMYMYIIRVFIVDILCNNFSRLSFLIISLTVSAMVKPKAVLEIERKIEGRTFLGFFHSLFIPCMCLS